MIGLLLPLAGIALMAAWTVGIIVAFALLDWRADR